jgi:NAD(P)H-dependent FMN reductase
LFSGFAAVLKNALDWGSRPPNVWGDKAAAVISAAGGSGGTRAQCHVRQIGIFLDLHFVNKPELFVRAHDGKFDENGDVIDAQLRSQIRTLISSLRSFSMRLRPMPS